MQFNLFFLVNVELRERNGNALFIEGVFNVSEKIEIHCPVVFGLAPGSQRIFKGAVLMRGNAGEGSGVFEYELMLVAN